MLTLNDLFKTISLCVTSEPLFARIFMIFMFLHVRYAAQFPVAIFKDFTIFHITNKEKNIKNRTKCHLITKLIL